MKKISRKFNWVSSLDDNQLMKLKELQHRMVEFYSNNNNYYKEIDFTSSYWIDNNQLLYQDTLNELIQADKILELGCGSANVLKTGKLNFQAYTGLEFSKHQINHNRLNFTNANFFQLENPYQIPIEDNTYNVVFSFFVIEHVVFPHKFLIECLRVLKQNGMLILMAPEFLNYSRLSSQRVGRNSGTGREKLARGEVLNAVLTGYDNKIRIPLKMKRLRKAVQNSPRFFINLTPICFEDDFKPDVDAVYITSETEIKEFLKNKVKWQNLDKRIMHYAKNNRLIYLKGVKI